MSKGIIEFAQVYKDIFKCASPELNYKLIVDWLNVLCSISTDDDIKKFDEIRHAGTMDHNNYEPLMSCWDKVKKVDPKTIRINLLGIPLLKCITRANLFKIKLFDLITVYKQIDEKKRKRIKLFGFIPIMTIKTKINDSATFYRPFGLFTLIKVKKGNK